MREVSIDDGLKAPKHGVYRPRGPAYSIDKQSPERDHGHRHARYVEALGSPSQRGGSVTDAQPPQVADSMRVGCSTH
jgi:hypothetical protein